MRRLRKARPLAVALASLGAAMVLAVGGFFGVKSFQSSEAQAKRAESCKLIKETEAVYANLRRNAAGRVPKVAFLGDSYSEGLYLATPLEAFPYLVGKIRGLSVAVNGVGGSGYVAGGPCEGQQLSTRLDVVLQSKPKLLVVQAGINDRAKAGVGDAALALFKRAQKISPGTKVVALGPFAPAGASGPDLDAVAEAVSTAAKSAGVTFIDPRGWKYSLQQDRLHPSDTGHKAIAEKLAAVLPSTP